MSDRFEVEIVENGFAVTVWKATEDESEKSDFGYVEPKKFVATTKDEVTKIFNDNF